MRRIHQPSGGGCIFVGRTELNIYTLGFYICHETRENSRRIVFSQSNGNKPKCIKGNANKYMRLRLCVVCHAYTHTHHKKQKERKRKRSVEKSKHVCMGFRVVRASQPTLSRKFKQIQSRLNPLSGGKGEPPAAATRAAQAFICILSPIHLSQHSEQGIKLETQHYDVLFYRGGLARRLI